MTSYKKRIQERDEALKEVYRLERLIYDYMAKRKLPEEFLSIALKVKTADELGRMYWMGETQGQECRLSIMDIINKQNL